MCITSKAYHSKPNAPESFGRILLEGKFIMGHVKFLREIRFFFFTICINQKSPFEIT